MRAPSIVHAVRRCLLAGVLIAGTPYVAAGQVQDVVLSSRAPRFLVAAKAGQAPVEVKMTGNALLRRVVSLEVARPTIGGLLAEIERQAGLRFGFSRDVVPVERAVTLRAERITVGAALLSILVDTGVDVLLSADGKVALVRRGITRLAWQGALAGQVTDSKSGAAIPNVEVLLGGTRSRAVTDTAGRYRLAEVEPGRYTLLVRRFGYVKHEQPVTVGEREDTVNVRLDPLATRLDELVTTATGERRRRDVPSDITTINADSVMRTQPVRSVTDLLEGRVPGLLMQRTSGAPGDPARLRLRGASSPNLSNDPIVVVDGIRVYAAQSDARSRNLATQDQPSGVPAYAAPSPLDYLDPNSIETIEVVKGPSATTLYGQDAANGVIVVTTKKGKAGPTRWTMSLDHGATGMVAKYPERVLRWGHTVLDQTPVVCPVGDVYSPPSDGCIGDSVVHFQLLNQPDLTPLKTGQRTAATLGVSGGVRTLTYSITGSYSRELGLLRLPDVEIARYENRLGQTPPEWMRRPEAFTQWGVTSELTAQLGAKADLTFRASLSQNNQQKSSLDNQLGDLDATYFDRASGIYYEADGLAGIQLYGGGGGILSSDHTLNDYYTKVTSEATALATGVHLNWHPMAWLTTQADAGINIDQRVDGLFLPYGAAPVITSLGSSDSTAYIGALNDGQGRSLVQTLNLGANITRPLGGFTLRLNTGVNYTSTAIRDVVITTTSLPAGQQVPGSKVGSPLANRSNFATFGWYVEPALAHGNFTLISGLRLDGGSSYGRGLSLPTFPKLGGTWTISDEPFFPFKALFSSVRLRAAYGRAGRQPGPADRLRLYSAPHPVSVGDQDVTVATLQTLGNTQLRPERTSEVEGGLDADFLDSRMSLSVTGYRKTTNDALVSTPLPPSIGIGSVLRNIGVTRNTGLDVVLGATLVRSTPLTWRTDLTVSHRRDEVVRLGPGVDPFNVGNDQRVAPGYPLYSYWERPVVGYADVNGDGLIEPGEVVVGDTAIYRGAPLPDYTATLSSSLSLWQGALQLTADLLHDHGMTQYPSPVLIARQVGLSAGRNDPTASLAEQALVASTFTSSGDGLTNYYWLQQVSTTRLNAISVSYTVPQTLARRVGAERLSLSLQARNLGLWSNYRGVDPNVNAYATGNLTSDGGQLPQPRTWQVQIHATY